MKLITLNTWGGRVSSAYKDFFDTYQDVDMWCFQEVNHNNPGRQVLVPGFEPDFELLKTLEGYLDSHSRYFVPTHKDIYGIATFLDSSIEVIEKGETLVAPGNWDWSSDDDNRDHHRKVQWTEVKIKGKRLLVINVHLTHRPAGKQDSEKRLQQSKVIIDLLAMFDCPKIVCGDFNLLPDTESICMIERAGMRNLVKECGITSTRTSLYKKPLPFADYIFVSADIKVKECKALPEEVSDHKALYLDFEME